MLSEALGRFTRLAPVVARLMVGGMMIVHGADKLAGDPAMFGKFLDEQLFSTGGVLGWLVILLEFVGGMFLVVLLAGPGRPSIDHVLGIERGSVALVATTEVAAPL